MGGKSTRKTRLAALDKIFSEWIRRKNANSDGIAHCVTCGARAHWRDMDAGHFWKRAHQATRFDPHNVHVQDTRCNRFRGGAEAEHAAYILKTYGKEVFDDLEIRHRQIKKWTKDEIESLIAYYRQKLQELERG